MARTRRVCQYHTAAAWNSFSRQIRRAAVTNLDSITMTMNAVINVSSSSINFLSFVFFSSIEELFLVLHQKLAHEMLRNLLLQTKRIEELEGHEF
jgi:hypothetical protein